MYTHPMRKKQLEFEGLARPKDSFGGELLKGNPKGKRPLASKLPLHLTLRAKKSVLRNPKVFGLVEKAIEETARKYRVKVYKKANVGNHLHLAIKLPRLEAWAGFIRELTGKIGLICKHLMKDGLWLFRPHTRIIRGWKTAFKAVFAYIHLNQLEGEGRVVRKPGLTRPHPA